MSNLKFGFLLVCTSLALSQHADAACVNTPTSWGNIAGNPSVKSDAKTDGAPCRHVFTSNGGSYESGAIIKKPKNGELVYVNTYTFEYTPKKGFKGKDNYIFKI